MALRDTIKRMYEDKGLDALWEWARGKPQRWEALKAWATDEAKRLGKELDDEREEREKAQHDLHQLGDEIVDLRERVNDNHKRLEEARKEGNAGRIRELVKRAGELDAEVRKMRARIENNEVQKKKAHAAAQDAKREKKAWLERKVVYREQWEKAKKNHADNNQGQPGAWEDWMAHGLDGNVNAGVKAFIAWGVLEYDLYATSLNRNFVPPGGSTTSYHLSGKAGDIAGSRMTEFQKAAYARYHGDSNCLELFGPDNGANLKYGSSIYLGEGTALENLHDSHDHGAFNG